MSTLVCFASIFNLQKRGINMFCQNCGKTLEDGCKFCSACGTPTPPSDEGFKVQSPEFETQPDVSPVQEETKVKNPVKVQKFL